MRLISLKIIAGLIEAKIFHDGVSAYFDLKLTDAENFNNLGIVIYPYNPDLLSYVVLLKGEEIVSERRTKQTNLADYGIEIRLFLIPIFRWYEIMNIPEYQLYGIRHHLRQRKKSWTCGRTKLVFHALLQKPNCRK